MKELLDKYWEFFKILAENDIKELLNLDDRVKARELLLSKLSDEEFLKLKKSNLNYLDNKAKLAEKSIEFIDELYKLAKKKAIEQLFTV